MKINTDGCYYSDYFTSYITSKENRCDFKLDTNNFFKEESKLSVILWKTNKSICLAKIKLSKSVQKFNSQAWYSEMA